MDDDLNTSKAFAALLDLATLGNTMLESGAESPEHMKSLTFIHRALLERGTTLGLFLQGPTEETPETRQRIQGLIDERDAARKAKDFARADAIRLRILDEGISIADTPNGPFWRRVR